VGLIVPHSATVTLTEAKDMVGEAELHSLVVVWHWFVSAFGLVPDLLERKSQLLNGHI
jgi:hypothetical protein